MHAALGAAATVLNVGAGAGSYEPDGRDVLAVEPSATMLCQRPPGSAPAVCAVAEHLPCADHRFDAALAVLTVHHWRDPATGLAELRRVSRRQVVFTWDVEVMARYWLVGEYLPEIAERERGLANLDAVVRGLSGPDRRVVVKPVPVPWDCSDGFLAAYWRRPQLPGRRRAGGHVRRGGAAVGRGATRSAETGRRPQLRQVAARPPRPPGPGFTGRRLPPGGRD
ncbi:class I SAM-dependent methyltransferase [Amycolatopsis sp. NPDC006131]|uniref:class I SAM-dependent methyltransferase n=1 Tax=Amycolatopsis sp. NPDC006131 TaxID=3156731 RepID=UPI0033ADFE5A